MKNYVLILLFFINLLTLSAQWEPTNGPYGGSIVAGVLKNDTLFAGSGRLGVFRSVDKGENWQRVSNGLPLYSGGRTFVVSKGQLFTAGYEGIFRSTNNGEEWTRQNGSLTIAEATIKSMAANEKFVFAANARGGVFRSSDNGENWEHADKGLTKDGSLNGIVLLHGKLFASFAYDQLLYRSTDDGENWELVSNTLGFEVMIENGEELIASGISQGVHRSTDDGVTWMPAYKHLEYAPTVQTIVQHDNKVFAYSTNAGLYTITNNGITWDSVNADSKKLRFTSFISDGENLFATSQIGMYRSTDNGITWKYIVNGLTGVEVSSFVQKGKYLYASVSTQEGRGIYRTSDNGETWSVSDSSLRIYRLFVKDATLYAIGADLYIVGDALYSFNETQEKWFKVQSNLYKGTLHCLYVNDNDIYVTASSQYGGSVIFKSSDNGTNWSIVGKWFQQEYIESIVAIGDTLILTTVNYVYRSTDKGENWVRVLSNLEPSQSPYCTVSKEGTVYVTALNEGVFRSDDKGESWLQLKDGLPENPSVGALLEKDGNIISTIGSNIYYAHYSDNKWLPLITNQPKRLFQKFYLKDNYIFANEFGSTVKRLDITDYLSHTNEELTSIQTPITLFPNPVRNEVSLYGMYSSLKPLKYVITDYVGRNVLEGTIPVGSETYTISVQNLTAGMYTLITDINGKSVQENFTVTR